MCEILRWNADMVAVSDTEYVCDRLGKTSAISLQNKTRYVKAQILGAHMETWRAMRAIMFEVDKPCVPCPLGHTPLEGSLLLGVLCVNCEAIPE